MEPVFESIALPGGRTLQLLLGGDRAGRALVMHHGTPSDRTTFADWHALCAERGLRLICASRPGYGGSSRQAQRTVGDVAADVGALLDTLGHGEFFTAGWSGGGPHALACAALMPDRCRAAATLAGVGAYGVPDLDFLAGMGPENVAEFGAACDGEAALRAWMDANAAPYRSVTGADLAAALGGLVPEADKQVLVGGFADRLAAVLRSALAQGYDGWIDDDLAFVRPWGFDLARIRVPVTVWQGELDLMVPHAHGRWLLDRVPGATGRLLAGQGHISLVTQFRAAMLDDLLAQGGRA